MTDFASPRAYYDQAVSEYDLAAGAGFIWFLGQDHLSPMVSNRDEFALYSDRWREGISQRIGEFLGHLDVQPSDVVLDLGSGVGGPARDLIAATGCNVVGANTSIEQLASSARHSAAMDVTKSHGVNADVRLLPFANESINHAYSINMQYHVTHPEVMLQEAGRVLKPGGRLALEDWFVTDTATPEQLADLQFMWMAPNGFHNIGLIKELLEDRGLQIIGERDFSEEAGEFLSEDRFGKTYDIQVAPVLTDAFPGLYDYPEFEPEHIPKAVKELRDAALYMGALYRSKQAVYRQIIAEKIPE